VGGCPCPEIDVGWAAYPETASIPDFLRRRSLDVREIVVCDCSAHLLFRAAQAGKQREFWLVVAEPTFDQILQRLPPDSLPSDADLAGMDDELAFQRTLFNEWMQDFRRLFGWPDGGNQHAVFKTGWFSRPPRIYLRKPLVFGWNGREFTIVGTVDVYFHR
jgi:hypothetical protein